jgi:endonuclease YncB( thermonuclease family)
MRCHYIHGCLFQLSWWIFTTNALTTTTTLLRCSVETRLTCQGSGHYPVETRRNIIKGSLGWTLVSAFAATFGPPTPSTNALSAVENVSYDKYYTAKDIPESIIESHQWLYGYVVKVIDGDTLRIRHVPNVETFVVPVNNNPATKMPLSNTTIVIRVYGIDAPETAKKPNETSQPFGEEAKQITKDLVYHKLVAVKLLRRDKYHRIVGEVETCVTASCKDPKDVSVELVSRGLATLYTGGGAEYDGKKELLRKSLEEAQRSKLGIWSLGEDEFVSPGEYKRKKRLAEEQRQP